MHRNGKTSQGRGATMQATATTAQPTATTMQLPAMTMQDAAATVQLPALTTQDAAVTRQGEATSRRRTANTIRRQLGGFASNAGIEARLVAAQVAIDTMLGDPDLLALMAAHGYDAARMQEGKALRDQALARHQQQRATYGEQFAATDARERAQAQAHTVYMRHVGVARVALRDDRGAAQKLDLAAARKRTRAGWLLQAQQFYANALADTMIVDELATYGVTREQLAATQQQVATVEAGLVAQQRTQGLAQEATRARDTALEALNRWMRDFLAIARVALADQPQLLEQLGVRMP